MAKYPPSQIWGLDLPPKYILLVQYFQACMYLRLIHRNQVDVLSPEKFLGCFFGHCRYGSNQNFWRLLHLHLSSRHFLGSVTRFGEGEERNFPSRQHL